MTRFSLLLFAGAAAACAAGFQSSDHLKLRSVGTVQFSPDGSRLAYTVLRNDAGRDPVDQVWILTLADGKSICLSAGDEPSGNPQWSPDGKWIAYSGRTGDRHGLIIARPDGGNKRFVASMEGTNSPLPTTGRTFTWSPDSRQIAYVSAQPGPETAEATGDPIVITRYLYKPTAGEGNSHFNDNKRLHIFVADVATGQSRQLTNGTHHEHSIEWSPDGKEIAFISNREPNEDQFFNYDLFALNAATGDIRRITATESAEYRPHWSPDGKSIVYMATKRGLTDLETTMEDTHVWLADSDGKSRRELGAAIDNRQGEPFWSADGRSVMVTVQEHGNVRLYRMPVDSGKPSLVVEEAGSVGAWSAYGNQVAFALATPGDLAELYLKTGDGPAKKLTDLNREVLANKRVEPVEPFTFISNDSKWTIEAFLTYPADFHPDRKYPMIVQIHGGPHGQQGRQFNFKAQVYASRGWASLMVNFRGSTGYGQAFTDAIFADQNGNEAQDVLYGVSAALRRNLWILSSTLGS